MKILFSLTYYSPYVSGLTNYVKTLAGELATKKGVEVSVLCMRHDPELSEMEIVDGVSVVRAKPDFALSKGYVSLDWFKKSWENVRNCDVVVVNLPQAEGLVPALMARLLRKRLISVYHARVELRGGLMDKLIELVLEGLNSEIMMLSHKVITYTDVYAKTLRVYKKIRHKIYSVYPPIKLPRENKAQSKTIRYKIPPGTKAVIGVAARLAEDKGFEKFSHNAQPKIDPKKALVMAVHAPPYKTKLDQVGQDHVGNNAYRNFIIKHQPKLVICGHIHHAANRDIGGIHYINTGDWVESCTAIGEKEDGTFELIRWHDVVKARQRETAAQLAEALQVA